MQGRSYSFLMLSNIDNIRCLILANCQKEQKIINVTPLKNIVKRDSNNIMMQNPSTDIRTL
jgi:hypothetical protein